LKHAQLAFFRNPKQLPGIQRDRFPLYLALLDARNDGAGHGEIAKSLHGAEAGVMELDRATKSAQLPRNARRRLSEIAARGKEIHTAGSYSPRSDFLPSVWAGINFHTRLITYVIV
jgi:hypothetical protein